MFRVLPPDPAYHFLLSCAFGLGFGIILTVCMFGLYILEYHLLLLSINRVVEISLLFYIPTDESWLFLLA